MSNFTTRSQNTSSTDTQDDWETRLLKAGTTATCLQEALQQAGITGEAYLRERDENPEFNKMTARFDQYLDLKMFDIVRQNALSGDIKFLTLYFTKIRATQTTPPHLRDLLSQKRPASSATSKQQPYNPPKPMHPDVAAAMIAAGLAAQNALPDDDETKAVYEKRPAHALLELALDPQPPDNSETNKQYQEQKTTILPISITRPTPAPTSEPAPCPELSASTPFLWDQILNRIPHTGNPQRNSPKRQPDTKPRKRSNTNKQPRSRPPEPPHDPLAGRSPHFSPPPARPPDDPHRNGVHPHDPLK